MGYLRNDQLNDNDWKAYLGALNYFSIFVWSICYQLCRKNIGRFGDAMIIWRTTRQAVLAKRLQKLWESIQNPKIPTQSQSQINACW